MKESKKSDSERRFDISVYIHIDSMPITTKGYPHTIHKHMSTLSPKEQHALAMELAKGLDDLKGLSFYKSACRTYSKETLYEVYAKALAVPDHKVIKSRGAIFNRLLQDYEPENDSWD